ncbi:MAG: ATP-dependent Clp protease ATP-binding subunit ClpX [Rhodocyclaceae bacterium]|nr:ATP-dependent Clp protease ATP-binding subunit ClpX [Rhodocyclaceae bacterium]MBX3666851.1 ATP-dependent Clp protease ATP-binding subunit ClpX [Rhodocyclaceae bacterium]
MSESILGSLTPSAIVRALDQFVIGQNEAKKIVAVAVYAHYKKLAVAAEGLEIAKSNVLLIGPTGSGKTLLCETLARILRVPFVTADATTLAQTEYVNEEIDAILQRLLEMAAGDTGRAASGIVFIDEVDKLKSRGGEAWRTSGESVQHALLKIMEGAPVRLRTGQYMDTRNVLFICGGAFVGLEDILATTHSYGYISTGGDDNQNILNRLNARVKPTDLSHFGLIPEFAGRLPIVARLQDLDRASLVRIMVEPRNAIARQFRSILHNEGVELVIEAPVLQQIADLAIEYKAGARSLRGIFEEMMTPILYVIPDRPEIRKVVISSLFDEPRFFAAKAN